MISSQRLALAGVAVAIAPAAVLALASSAPGAPARDSTPSAAERALLHSHELWATIDICSPPNQRNTVGVRGSMPGNDQAHDTMYMSFRLQYQAKDKHWLNVASASSNWVSVGSGGSPRQGGWSFGLKPPATGKPAVTLRGVVDFQWRHDSTVLVAAAEPTSAGHKSLAGADPADYSAATCLIG
jgi:hypothetical protein